VAFWWLCACTTDLPASGLWRMGFGCVAEGLPRKMAQTALLDCTGLHLYILPILLHRPTHAAACHLPTTTLFLPPTPAVSAHRPAFCLTLFCSPPPCDHPSVHENMQTMTTHLCLHLHIACYFGGFHFMLQGAAISGHEIVLHALKTRESIALGMLIQLCNTPVTFSELLLLPSAFLGHSYSLGKHVLANAHGPWCLLLLPFCVVSNACLFMTKG